MNIKQDMQTAKTWGFKVPCVSSFLSPPLCPQTPGIGQRLRVDFTLTKIMTRTQKKINQKGNYYCKGCPAFLLGLVRIT